MFKEDIADVNSSTKCHSGNFFDSTREIPLAGNKAELSAAECNGSGETTTVGFWLGDYR